MSRAKYETNCKEELQVIEMTKRVLVFKIFSMKDFNKQMEQIESTILKYKTSLVIIDSLASLVRREFSGNNAVILGERSKFLCKISTYLKKIAQILEVSVSLIIFQVHLILHNHLFFYL